MAIVPARFEGIIEGRFGEQVYGWCRRTDDDATVILALYVNDEAVATFSADYPRGDLLEAGIGNGQYGFFSPNDLGKIADDAIIRVKVAGTEVELVHSGQAFSTYRQLAAPHRSSGAHVLPKTAALNGIPSSSFPKVNDAAALRAAPFARLAVEPPGTMRMPPYRVANRAADGYRVSSPSGIPVDRRLPSVLPFPEMTITTVEDAYFLPFSAPFLVTQRQLVTDFLVPWAQSTVAWFNSVDGKVFYANIDVDLTDIEHDIDVAFYMDHTMSEHFGHFVGDCLCRMYAWDIVRQIFGNAKLVIARHRAHTDFQERLLLAAGAAPTDVIKINNVVRCKRLLLATQSFGVEQFASPASARLWSSIRDRMARRDISLPDRIYLSRSSIRVRPLVNELEVERVFARFGFAIVHPETLRVEQQIALASNALLIAGPGGSAMFNLAFQGRLRSAFILAREHRVQLIEMLLCAGRSCDIWYHLGTDVTEEAMPPDGAPWCIDPVRLASDVADWIAASMG